MGCDILVKLPKIFHNDDYIASNNRTSFSSFQEERVKEVKDNDLFQYLNRVVDITLSNNDSISGKIISIRDDKILLNNGISININNILNIK